MIEVDETNPVANDPAAREDEGGAAASAGAREVSTDAPRAASHFKPLVLQQDTGLSVKDHYHVEELLQYHDERFIENAYLALAGRAAFETERARELDALRNGRASKVEIIERLLTLPEAARRGVRVEGLPSPLMRRMDRVPVLGYVLRLASALVRLPVLMQHQQQFEIYALAQQQLITDHVNQVFTLHAQGTALPVGSGGDSVHVSGLAQYTEIVETVEMFSDALLDLSNGHAELQTQVQTQAEQVQAALTDLTGALTAQQQITETLRREQQTTVDAQQEYLIQEQRVIVETQKVVLEELREELRTLAERQESLRAELEREVRRLQTLLDAATTTSSRENFSGQ